MTTPFAKKQLFLNYKGGTGKTSISSAYGYCLATQGHRVLMVDLDAQAHLTTCLNSEEVLRQGKSLYGVMVKDDRVSDIIMPTQLENLKLIPSSISLSALEVPLFRMHLREFRLRQILREVERDFDFIIIDSAPSINLLSLNAILASDEILIPLLADFLSFHGLKILMETLASIEKDFRFYLGRIHIFLNRFNPQYAICNECKEAVHKFYPDYALDTVINEAHEIIEASSMGRSIFDLYPDSGAVSDIRNLVQEVNKVSASEENLMIAEAK